MAPHTPSPDEAEYAFFLVRWWKEFFLGLVAFLSAIALIRKGRNVPLVVALSEKQIDQKLLICKQELQKDLTDAFYGALEKHESHILQQVALMIQADKND